MKTITISEARAKLSHYGKLCQTEPIVVSVNGSPAFQLVPIPDNDDLIDQLLKHNPAFRRTLKARLKEPALSAKEAAKRL